MAFISAASLDRNTGVETTMIPSGARNSSETDPRRRGVRVVHAAQQQPNTSRVFHRNTTGAAISPSLSINALSDYQHHQPSLTTTTSARYGSPVSCRWNPHCHSALRVLEAPGMPEDFYSQNLSFGEHYLAAVLGSKVLVFSPEDNKKFASYSISLPQQPVGRSNGAETPPPPPQVPFTAVCIAKVCSSGPSPDSRVYIGDDLGVLHVCHFSPNQQSMQSVAANFHPSCHVDPSGEEEENLEEGDDGSGGGLTSNRIVTIDSHPSNPHVGVIGNARGYVSIFDTRSPELFIKHAGKTACSRTGRDHCVHEGRVNQLPQAHVGGPCCKVAFSPTGDFIATGGNDNLVKVWSLEDLSAPIFVHSGHTAAVKALAWNPEVRGVLASGGGSLDASIQVYSIFQQQQNSHAQSNRGRVSTTPSSDHVCATSSPLLLEGAPPGPVPLSHLAESSSATLLHRQSGSSQSLLGDEANGVFSTTSATGYSQQNGGGGAGKDNSSTSGLLAQARSTAQVTGLDWSPDGRWLLSIHGFHVEEDLLDSTGSPWRRNRGAQRQATGLNGGVNNNNERDPTDTNASRGPLWGELSSSTGVPGTAPYMRDVHSATGLKLEEVSSNSMVVWSCPPLLQQHTSCPSDTRLFSPSPQRGREGHTTATPTQPLVLSPTATASAPSEGLRQLNPNASASMKGKYTPVPAGASSSTSLAHYDNNGRESPIFPQQGGGISPYQTPGAVLDEDLLMMNSTARLTNEVANLSLLSESRETEDREDRLFTASTSLNHHQPINKAAEQSLVGASPSSSSSSSLLKKHKEIPKVHGSRPLHLSWQRNSASSGMTHEQPIVVTAAGGDIDSTLRFWAPFNTVGGTVGDKEASLLAAEGSKSGVKSRGTAGGSASAGRWSASSPSTGFNPAGMLGEELR